MQQNSEDQIIGEIVNRIDALRYECGYCPKITTTYKLCNAFGIAVWQFFLFPNNIVTFTKEKIDLLNRIDKLNYEQKKAIISTLEAFEKQ